MIVSDITGAKTFSVAPGVTNKLLLSGDEITLVYVELAEGSAIPIHSHPHEQMGMCLRGEAEFDTEEGRTLVKAGMFYHIRGNERHGAKPLGKGGAVLLDIFSPPREDFLARVKG